MREYGLTMIRGAGGLSECDARGAKPGARQPAVSERHGKLMIVPPAEPHSMTFPGEHVKVAEHPKWRLVLSIPRPQHVLSTLLATPAIELFPFRNLIAVFIMARQSTSSSAVTSNGQVHANGSARPTTHANQDDDTDNDFDFDNDPRHRTATKPIAYDPSLLPNGSRSLSSIGLQAFWLGFGLAFCLCSTTWLLLNEYAIWRLPAFFAGLSLFHSLEYYTTARFNVPTVRASSFLLFNNGRAYNTAHGLATLEIVVSSFFPTYQSRLVHPITIAAGLALIFIGQTVRSVAMAQAGTNFNHTPVQTRKEDHVLVTTGLYGYLRHPSYFGFFWWALGTQLLVGNKVCFVGYAIALWLFFYRRIIGRWFCDYVACCVCVLTVPCSGRATACRVLRQGLRGLPKTDPYWHPVRQVDDQSSLSPVSPLKHPPFLHHNTISRARQAPGTHPSSRRGSDIHASRRSS